MTCNNINDLLEYLRLAHSRQRYAETAMNSRSSRAHTVLILHIQQQAKRKDILAAISPITPSIAYPNTLTETVADDDEMLLIQNQLHLVDLAGSERIKKSKVTGQRMKEAVGINSSLLVLGKVISSLVKGETHVPYLESRLTTLLKAAFGGNARTMVMVNTRPEADYGDETLQSLRFGERCSMISNTLRQMATSLDATMEALDHALQTMEGQLSSLAARNKQHLDSYKALQASYEGLKKKKDELVKTHQQAEGNSKNTSQHRVYHHKPKVHRTELYM